MKLLTSEWVQPVADDPARFRIRGLTYVEMLEFHEAGEAGGGKTSAAMDFVLARGVIGWEGVVDDDDRPVAFETGAAADLDRQFAAPVAERILEKSRLTGEQEKNSSSPSTSRRERRTTTAAPADGAAIATSAIPRPSRNGKS